MINRVIGLLLILFCLSVVVYAQTGWRLPEQIDPEDMNTRRAIDQGLQRQLLFLDREIQSDTTVFNVGNTADTVYLDNKYPDLSYTVFVIYRTHRGAIDSKHPAAYPLTDSSFIISAKNAADTSFVNWMTIYKGD